MVIIQDYKNQFFAGYKPVQGRMAGVKPHFVNPHGKELFQVAVYENAVDAIKEANELNSKGYDVSVIDLVLTHAEFLSARLGRVAKLAGVVMPRNMTPEQIVEVAGTILGQIAFALETKFAGGPK